MHVLNGHIDPKFQSVADVFARQLPKKGDGGAALSVYFEGEKVVDIWAGTRNNSGAPWEEDTLALSWSTTKGITSTLLHILIDQGLANYDDPIALYWPEFGSNGKEQITIRQALSHKAGLHQIKDHFSSCKQMLDWQAALDAIATASPPTGKNQNAGYHGLTFGFLIGGLIERITNRGFQEVLNELLVKPLDLQGAFVGVSDYELGRCAALINGHSQSERFHIEKITDGFNHPAKNFFLQLLKLINFDIETALGAFTFSSRENFCWNSDDCIQSIQPSANGMFTARSLAKVYAMLAQGGEIEGKRILSREAVNTLGQIQNRERDQVLFLPMHWRMGYHRVFTLGRSIANGFGHFGFGGSGAWCDPSRQLSCAMTVNTGLGTPIGDTRLLFINSAVTACADRASTTEIRSHGGFNLRL